MTRPKAISNVTRYLTPAENLALGKFPLSGEQNAWLFKLLAAIIERVTDDTHEAAYQSGLEEGREK